MQFGSVNVSATCHCRPSQTSALHSAVTVLTPSDNAPGTNILCCSCSGSDSESTSLPPDGGDQVVPSHGHHLHQEVRGLADAAWDDAEPRAPSPQPPPVRAESPPAHAQTSAPEPEPELRPEQGEEHKDILGSLSYSCLLSGWLENDLKSSISLGFLDDNDDLGENAELFL